MVNRYTWQYKTSSVALSDNDLLVIVDNDLLVIVWREKKVMLLPSDAGTATNGKQVYATIQEL